ncbi:MlaD family protein [Stackebrandtia nassauensis]|uniref:Virulence factor Mce family protein n=1 Tax=Stackebrandtia nassauensis (strain DSM 44728 / CIP 108903 / NRRL B-16338 / NBRC 102104 / LLR-40K-21) TaxID=446470 RepID=D3QB66_STANL|nr:MlaD family protein [Stackebrandtia nassauensis]ADD40883.1 virulence factor Mce family protein [Stackebrandtia nassauensis DSM 44728]
MISRKLRLQIGVFALISLLGIAFVGVRYLGWFDSSYVVYVDAKETGGAYEHAAVAYRGVPIGRVGEVKLHGKGARMELRIDSETKVPKDVKAVVAQRSAVGEQYVDLRPNTAEGPYLGEGDVVDDVATPLPMEQLLANLDGLLESVDPDDLKVVIDELGAAFEGNEESLDKMLDATQTLIDDAAEHLPETVDLLKDGKTVLETQDDSASAIRTWADKLSELTTTVKKSDKDIRKLLDVGPEAADEVSGLIHDLDPNLGTLLGNMISVNGVAVQRLPNIEEVLVTYPMVISGGSTVTPGDGTAHFGLVLNFDNPPPCVYGEGNDGYECTAGEQGEGSAVRGWQHAPGATGPAIEPVPLPESGASKDGDSDDDGEGTAQGGDADTESSRYGYDPLTGLLVDSDGMPIQFGSTGGQYELAGEESWKSLLLTGVMS